MSCRLDNGYVLAACHISHGIGIVSMGLHDLGLGVVEAAALGRCDEDDVAAFLAHEVDVFLEVVLEVVPGAGARAFLFLVVVSELTDDVVAFVHHGQHLVETVACEERAGGQPTRHDWRWPPQDQTIG